MASFQLTFTELLWDHGKEHPVAATFVVTLDTGRIPAKFLYRAMKNKSGKSQIADGTVTIEVAKKEPRP